MRLNLDAITVAGFVELLFFDDPRDRVKGKELLLDKTFAKNWSALGSKSPPGYPGHRSQNIKHTENII